MQAGLLSSMHGESHRAVSGEEASNPSGQIVLYMRVSTNEQNLALQRDALKAVQASAVGHAHLSL
jgi:predicted site-specific integrase-resolvase